MVALVLLLVLCLVIVSSFRINLLVRWKVMKKLNLLILTQREDKKSINPRKE